MSQRTQNMRLLFWLGPLALILACAAVLTRTQTSLAAQGLIEIAAQGGTEASYDAYCLFTADIDEAGRAQHVSWPSSAVQEAIVAFLMDQGYPGWLEAQGMDDNQLGSARSAAAFIAHMFGAEVEASAEGSAPRTTEAMSFAQGLAHQLVSCGAVEPQKASSQEPFACEQGFWLLVGSSEEDGAQASPIWLPIGTKPQTIVSKTSEPTISKRVQEDATAAWGTTADAQIGQSVTFMITGTLPSNYGAYERYHLRFEDTLSKGLSLSVPDTSSAADAISISLNDQAVDAHTEGLSVSYEAGVLTVDFADLKQAQWAGFNITKDTVITIVYQAHLNQECLVGMAGNDNAAKLVYTRYPSGDQDGETPQVKAKLFCYALQLIKVSDTDGKPLAQAEFTLRVADDNTDQASRGLFVQKDGTLGTTAHHFVTDGTGMVRVSGLDEGSYVITEVGAPPGYQRITEDLGLKIVASRDDDAQALSILEATAVSGKARVEGLSAEAGLVSVSVENSPTKTSTPGRQLPQTGVGPIALTLIAGGLILLVVSRTSCKAREKSRHMSS